MRLIDFLFRLDGRASRLDYWRYQLLQVVGAGIIMALTLWVADLGGPGFLPFLLMIPLLAGGVPVIIRRAHDRGRPAGWALFLGLTPLLSYAVAASLGATVSDPESSQGLIVTLLELLLMLAAMVVSVWALIEFGFLRGTPGPNRYGPPPAVRLSLLETVRG